MRGRAAGPDVDKEGLEGLRGCKFAGIGWVTDFPGDFVFLEGNVYSDDLYGARGSRYEDLGLSESLERLGL